MRAYCLVLCAALALCCCAAQHATLPRTTHQRPYYKRGATESRPSVRLDHIKRQILAKLGLSSRPSRLRAPPRDVVRQILARAADTTHDLTTTRLRHHHDDTMETAEEIIAISQTVNRVMYKLPNHLMHHPE